MVAEIWLNMTSDVAVMFSTTPTAMVYFFVFFFASFIAIVMTVATKKPYAGLMGFFGMMLVFSVLDALPLWIVVVPIVIAIGISYYALRSSTMGGE